MYVSVLKVIRTQTPVLSSHILQLTSVPPRSRGPKRPKYSVTVSVAVRRRLSCSHARATCGELESMQQVRRHNRSVWELALESRQQQSSLSGARRWRKSRRCSKSVAGLDSISGPSRGGERCPEVAR